MGGTINGWTRLLATLCLLAGLVGCGTESAGEAEEWLEQVPVEALRELGRTQGDFLAAVTDAAIRPDGAILVSDFRNAVVHMLDPELNLIMQIGRKGPGPGEFGRPGTIQILGDDTLSVWDFGRRRIVRFDREGRFIQGVEVPAHSLLSVHRFAGQYVGLGQTAPVGIEEIDRNRTSWLVRLDPAAGMVIDTLAVWIPNDVLSIPLGDMSFVAPDPFGRRHIVAPAGNRLLAVWTEDLAVHEITADWSADTVFAASLPQTRVYEADIEAFATNLADIAREPVRRWLIENGRAVWPAILDMTADHERVYLRMAGDEGEQLLVLSLDGRPLWRAAWPRGYRLLAGRGDDVIATIDADEHLNGPSIIRLGRTH